MKRKVTNDARRISGAETPPPRIRAEGARGGSRDWSTSKRRATSSWTKKQAAIERYTTRTASDASSPRSEAVRVVCVQDVAPRVAHVVRKSGRSRETLARGLSAPSRRSRAPPLPDARATDVRLREPRDGPEQTLDRRAVWGFSQRELVHPAVMDEFCSVTVSWLARSQMESSTCNSVSSDAHTISPRLCGGRRLDGNA